MLCYTYIYRRKAKSERRLDHWHAVLSSMDKLGQQEEQLEKIVEANRALERRYALLRLTLSPKLLHRRIVTS